MTRSDALRWAWATLTGSSPGALQMSAQVSAMADPVVPNWAMVRLVRGDPVPLGPGMTALVADAAPVVVAEPVGDEAWR
eukprot:1407756-Alexandrium_andersonii.AAC.1